MSRLICKEGVVVYLTLILRRIVRPSQQLIIHIGRKFLKLLACEAGELLSRRGAGVCRL